jgi:hypothetical protein
MQLGPRVPESNRFKARGDATVMRPIAILALAAAPALAGEEGTDIEKIKLGEHVYGPKLDIADLKGHVVLLEFWGIR